MSKLVIAGLITVFVMTTSLIPMFKPRPRRVLDTLSVTEKRLVIAILGLATLGYADYSYRLPRSTLIIITVVLGICLPALFVAIRRQPTDTNAPAIVVGDDVRYVADILKNVNTPILGYVSPSSGNEVRRGKLERVVTDGGTEQPLLGIERLGGLSRLENVLIEKGVDTAILAFSTTDRAEFFGALDTCHKHGVTAKAPTRHIDSVLTKTEATEDDELVEIALEPWDWQDYIFKRIFDVLFATFSLLAFAPLLAIIALAVKLDSPGPVFYSQARTAEFGGTFQVYKFRSMVTNAEAETGAKVSEEDKGEIDPRVTRVGRILRKTHLDEIPQLWSILIGDMSVVGPRPERPELDSDIETGVVEWRKRWFIKPGLTGLAQISDATGHEPAKKLRYDIEYIRRQTFWFDVQIVTRQLWQVVKDVNDLIRRKEQEDQ
ncbi:sugar transferase [Haladaptatus sp. CMAA 1911]|uniref:sugar transferase n=1 Tax=unclassified Haladaptatus TaxID=2622732 RepID=UPI0037542E9B